MAEKQYSVSEAPTAEVWIEIEESMREPPRVRSWVCRRCQLCQGPGHHWTASRDAADQRRSAEAGNSAAKRPSHVSTDQ